MIRELSEGWKETKFDEIGEFLRGPFGSSVKKSVCVIKDQENYKLYEQGNVINNDFKRGSYYITKERFNELKKFELLPGDIVFTCAGTLGKIAIVPENIEKGIINSVLMRIRLNEKKILRKYFVYFFRTPQTQNQIFSKSEGATIKNLFATKKLKSFKILLPPLETQNKIVAILEKAEETKQLRVKIDELTNRLLQSVFFEMFGEPKNNKKFEKTKIASLILKTDTENPIIEYPNKTFKYIDISSIDAKTGKIISSSELLGKDAPSRARQKIKSEDILVSTVRPNLNAVAMVPKSLNNQICSTGFCILRCNTQIIPEYLFSICRSSYFIDSLIKKCKGANYPAVSSSDIKSVLIQLPPLVLQKKFAEIVKQVEHTREQQKNSKEQCENLCNVLMQKAFIGELEA